MSPLHLPADYAVASAAPPKKGLRFAKELFSGLGMLILVNIVVLGVVGILRSSGVPKALANPLQLLYLPLMWLGLRFLKRRYQLVSSWPAQGLGSRLGRAGVALLLVLGMAGLIITLLHSYYGLGISLELLTTDAYRWVFMALLLGEAAAVEELVFRDYLLHATAKVTANFYALAVVNASAFLLLHIQGFFLGDYTALWGVSVFLIGLVLAAYVLVFRDLIFPICFHAFWNISTTMYGEDDKTFNLVKFAQFKTHEVLINDVMAAVCIGVTAILFGLLAYRYHRQSAPEIV